VKNPLMVNKFKQLNLNIDKDHTDKATAYIDGASKGNPGSSSIGVLLTDSNGIVHKIKGYIGILTNNQAEYHALITALKAAKKLKESHLTIYTDSQLLANQINNIWRVRNPQIKTLYKEAIELISTFKKIGINHIPRSLNQEADKLANEALVNYHT